MSAPSSPRTKVYGVPQDVGWVWLGDEGNSELVVSHLPAGPPHVLGSGAAMIWWLAAGRTLDQVVDEIADLTGQSAEELAGVVGDFLGTLEQDRLLEMWSEGT